jgi:hypothetical protein
LTITEWKDLRGALETRERIVDPPRPVRVKWGGEWFTPALLHGWKRDEERDLWFGCVEYYRQFAPGFGIAVGRWTPVWNIEPADATTTPPP